jgi:pilus assembly protein CpaB
MEPKKIALLVGAVVIAATTAFMARSMFSQAAAPVAEAIIAPQPTGPEVLVATRSLPVGSILTPDAFSYQPWPKDLVENAYLVKGQTSGADKDGNGGISEPTQLHGTVVRTAIAAGQPVTLGSLVKPGDRGFLAAALAPGMRAVTIRLGDDTATVSGFVFAGDRVDLMLTQAMDVTDEPQKLRTSETIMRNLRVLATDKRATKQTDEAGNTVVAGYNFLTIEATPRMAEKIVVAQTLGTLSVSLRSIADSTSELDRAIASGDVKLPKDGSAEAQRQMMASIAGRPVDSSPTYVTGADVSRFQRRSAPSMQRPIRTVPVKGVTVLPSQQAAGVRVSRGGDTTEVKFGDK